MKNSKDEYRDRFVLSKGHISPLYYSILSQIGYFPEEELKSFRKLNTRLQGSA
jgi:transketolase